MKRLRLTDRLRYPCQRMRLSKLVNIDKKYYYTSHFVSSRRITTVELMNVLIKSYVIKRNGFCVICYGIQWVTHATSGVKPCILSQFETICICTTVSLSKNNVTPILMLRLLKANKLASFNTFAIILRFSKATLSDLAKHIRAGHIIIVGM